ncbi:dihydroneopterin aldolase [Telmatospirillum sp. J64-1]|uniref:dihydroneopterin aldolase n=1 Tax=Telmatospirillum sp. J64-1 TaxID=2502183 RepID=UPI00115CC851|nr:dihydroneopterin aldolase [Telmatospirillum sp. J64-1]
MSQAKVIQPLRVSPLRIADAQGSMRHVFVRDLVLDCSIGVYAHEKMAPQRVRVNLDLGVRELDPAMIGDEIGNVVCYEKIVTGVRAIVADGHVNLVETLAERIAEMCLLDPRVRTARVRVEKLDVFEDAASVGVEIERLNPLP